MKKILLLIAIVFASLMAMAQQQPTMLPNIALFDQDGNPTSSERLSLEKNWIMVVLDASLPSAKMFLSTLSTKPQIFNSQLTVLVIGDSRQIKELAPLQEKLPGVRWVYSKEVNAIKKLNLPGTPVIIGLTNNQKIAWQFSGPQNSSEKLYSMIQGWIGKP